MPEGEGCGHPHLMVVRRDEEKPAELVYDLLHPASCKEVVLYDGPVTDYDCDVAYHEREAGLFWCLSYTGTPVTRPGTYLIRGWWHRGTEVDASVEVIRKLSGWDGFRRRILRRRFI